MNPDIQIYLDETPDNAVTILDDLGRPVGGIDRDQTRTSGHALSLELALAAHDPEGVTNLIDQALETHGPRVFGYVAADALRHMSSTVLAVALGTLEVEGADLRPDLLDAAETTWEKNR